MRRAGLTWVGAVLAAVVVAMAVPSFASGLAFRATSQTPLPEMTGVNDIASGDFNEDGNDDLAVAAEGGVVIWLSNGDGTFTKGETLPIESNIGASGSAAVAGDFNGDGKLDVAYSDGPYKLYIALGKADGTFEPPAAGTKFSLPFFIGGGQLAAGNLRGGASEDLVLAGGIHNDANESAGYQVIGYELGAFAQHSVVPVSIANQSSLLGDAVGDYSGDGKQDLALLTQPFSIGNYTANQVYGEVGQGNGTFTAAPANPISLGLTEAGFAYSEATANLNGTGGDDLLVGISRNYSTLPLLGSSGEFLAADTAGSFAGTGLPNRLAAADLTGGGLDEAIPAYFDGNGSIGVGLSDGTGKLTAAPGSPFKSGQEHFFDSSISVGDFNGDGYPDVAIGSNANGGTVTQGVAVMVNSPRLEYAPQELDFGEVEVGQTEIGTVTLTDTGAPPLNVSKVEVSTLGSPFRVLNPTACATVPSGEECEVEVEYSPTVGGEAGGTLSITADTGTDGGDAVSAVALSGVGLAPGVALTPASQDFGTVQIGGTPVTRSFTIKSTGGAALAVSKVSLSSEADFRLASPSPCAGSLPASKGCVVNVSFNPAAGTAGARSATLTVETNAGTRTASLSGTAGAAPTPTPTPSAKLKLGAPAAIRPGKTVSLKVQVTDTGKSAISGLKLTVKAPKSLALVPRPLTISSLATGKSVSKTIAVKVKSSAAKGKELKLVVTASTGATTLAKSARKVKLR